MSGEHFAFIYDYLMKDIPYDRFTSYAEARLPKNGVIADLGCGTGTILLQLLERNYEMMGIDISQDMLAVAESKLRDKNWRVPLIQQDMRDFSSPSQLAGVTIFLDGLNYLQTESDVMETFSKVYAALRTGGVFLFDVHSVRKMEEEFHHELYGENDDKVSYLWFVSPGKEANSVEHDFTFFVKREEDDVYDRFDESHKQRTFPVEVYSQWLKEAGFENIEVTSDFGKSKSLNGQEDRLFFQAIKK